MRFLFPLFYFTCSPKLEVLFFPFCFLFVGCLSFVLRFNAPAVPSPHIIVVLFFCFLFFHAQLEVKKSDVFMIEFTRKSAIDAVGSDAEPNLLNFHSRCPTCFLHSNPSFCQFGHPAGEKGEDSSPLPIKNQAKVERDGDTMSFWAKCCVEIV